MLMVRSVNGAKVYIPIAPLRRADKKDTNYVSDSWSIIHMWRDQKESKSKWVTYEAIMAVTDRRGRQAAGVYQAFPTRQVVYTLERYVRGK